MLITGAGLFLLVSGIVGGDGMFLPRYVRVVLGGAMIVVSVWMWLKARKKG